MSTTQVSNWYGVSLPGKEAMFTGTDAEKVNLRYACNRFFKELHPKQHARYFPDARNGHTGPCSNLKNLQRWTGKTFRFSKSAKGDLRIVDIKSRKNKVVYRNGGH